MFLDTHKCKALIHTHHVHVLTKEPTVNDFNVTTPSHLAPEERTIASLVHVSGLLASFLGGAAFLGPLLVYFLTLNRSPELRAHVFEALNFSISATLAIWILGGSMVLVITIPIALPLLIIACIGYIVYAVLGALDASNDRLRRYPFTWRLITS